jgi:hypothetical protein
LIANLGIAAGYMNLRVLNDTYPSGIQKNLVHAPFSHSGRLGQHFE